MFYLIACSFSFFPVVMFSAVSSLQFTTISMDNGLSNNTINTIYKDSVGFIWLGTQNGLNRFDGINIDVYPEFNDETIFTICETDSGHLWVGTNFGLKVLNRKTGTVQKVKPDDITSTAVRYLKTLNNTLYICTDNGFFTLKDDTIHKVPVSNAINLTGLVIDKEENYWLASNEGLIFYNPQTKESQLFSYSATNPALNKFYCSIIVGATIYIGSENAGVLMFDINSRTFKKFMNLGNDCILNLNYYNNKLYVGTNGSGLKIVSLENGSVTTIAHDPNNPVSVSSNAIYSFLIDNGTYWIGTFFAGLNYNIFIDDFFKVYSFSDKLNTHELNVRSFWIGNDGRKIIGTRNGFYYISENKSIFRNFSSENTEVLKSNIILNIYPWNELFLIGTYSGGLYIFDPESMTLSEFKEDQIFRNNSFYSFSSDKSGRIWCGTLGGVICFNPETKEIEHYTSSNSELTDNSVFSILCDSRNRVWIGTGEGLCIYDHTTKTIKKDILSMNFKMIRHIFEDKEGNIWLCSEKNGLIRFNADLSEYSNFTDKNLLPDIFAISTIEDDFGYIWIATAKGLIRFDKHTDNYSIFSSMDGIPAQMFNHVVQKDKKGTIWWANEKGLLYTLPPEGLEKSNSKKPVVITAVYVGGKKVDPGSKSLDYAPEFASTIELDAEQNNVDVRFSNLNFSYPKSELFEYKLEGVDSAWNMLIGQNQIHYTDLKPGNYKLHIRNAGSLELEKTILIIKKRSYTIYIWIGISLLIILIGIYFYRIQFIKLSSLKNLIIDSTKKKMENQEKYQRSRLEEEESVSIRDALLKYMEEEKPYLNSKLKLADVSAAIQQPQAKISQVLNQSLETNFTDFLNKYRVKEFMKRAGSDSIHQYTLTALSERCGFNSRSSFFHVFKKITGQTPLEFLKEAGIVLDKDKL